MPLGLKHTAEAKSRIGAGARGLGRGGFNVKTTCPDCNRPMSPANLGKHAPACEKTKRLIRLFGYRPNTSEMKTFERCLRGYGITTELYLFQIEHQEWRCPICGLSLEGKDGVRCRIAFVDHDHETGKFRGLLCRLCNLLLGAVGDDYRVLLRAAEYLKRDVEGCEIEYYKD